MIFFAFFACQADTDTSFWNHKASPEPNNETGDVDSGNAEENPLEGFGVGDPILFVGTDPEPGSIGMEPAPEWIAGAVIDDNTVVMCGQGGIGTMNLQTGEVLATFDSPRGLHIDVSDGIAIVSSRTDQLTYYDVSNPMDIKVGLSLQKHDIPHEGVAIQGNRSYVAWRSRGLRVYNLDMNLVSVFDASDASVIDVHNNRAVLVDGKTLKLLDISNPASISELASTELAGPATDIMMDDQHIAVGLGSRGVEIFEHDNTALSRKGQWTFTGAVQGLSLDGEHLWLATWTSTVVMNIARSEPVVLGLERPVNAAFGVAARNGHAVIADWYYSTSYQLVEGVAAAEVYTPEELYFQNDVQSNQWFRIVNGGGRPLEITLEPALGDYVLNGAGTYTIAPGAHQSLNIATTINGNFGDGQISWSSNDPDDPFGAIVMRPASRGVGSQHPDFELPLLSYPDGLLGNFSLSDHVGKVIYMAWWADY